MLGPVLWGASVWRLRQTGELRLFGLHMLIPALGFVVDRPYWGVPLIPFTIVWGGEALGAAVTAVTSRR